MNAKQKAIQVITMMPDKCMQKEARETSEKTSKTTTFMAKRLDDETKKGKVSSTKLQRSKA
jgi:hypothetical protein